MTGIPAAAVQTIRAAAVDGQHLDPDALTDQITHALADAGWQITPADIEDDHPEDPR
ncbi:hypothetical protein ACWGB8_07970 [Kitasatospora sp. NPDC054939]